MNDHKNIKFNLAAVLLPLFEKKGEFYIVFTKRSHTVLHHKGQICFPGGSVEKKDKSLWHTALRETKEEIGLNPSEVFYVNRLPILNTPTLFEVTPFIGFLYRKVNFILNPSEVDSVITVPLKHLINKKNLRFEKREYFGKVCSVPFFTYGEHEIWGATGRILLSLLEKWK